jgi:hypothetical protein
MILNRLKAPTPKNKHYAGRSLDMTKEEFEKWFMLNDFKGCSVDRIDNSKGYSLSNLQMLPLAINIIKDKTAFNGITHTCSICKETKPKEKFAKDARRAAKISSICKQCDSRRNSQQNSTGV